MDREDEIRDGRDRTVIVNNDRTDRSRGGGSGFLIAGILIALLVIGGYFWFGGFGGGDAVGDATGDVNIEAPDVNVETPDVEAPEVGGVEAPATGN